MIVFFIFVYLFTAAESASLLRTEGMSKITSPRRPQTAE